jgi:NADP-dependent 3-hydroxy acid dehydrogenase YdfG
LGNIQPAATNPSASVTIVGRRLEKLEGARETFDAPDKVHTLRCDLTIKDELGGLIRLKFFKKFLKIV